jgi:hypothetical protein
VTDANGAPGPKVENEGRNAGLENRLMELAENFGRLVGTAEHKATTLLGGREEIARQLTQIRDTCNSYLQELTSGGAALADAIRRGRGETRPPSASEAGTPAPADSKVPSEPGQSGGPRDLPD